MKKNTIYKKMILAIFAFAVPFSFFSVAPDISADEAIGASAPVSMEYIDYLVSGEADEYAPEMYDLDLYSADMQPASLVTASEFPEKYDLRSDGLVTPVKNQGSYGTCWSFSAMSSIETQLIKKHSDIDLSEWHLAYFTYTGNSQFQPIGSNIFLEGGHNNYAAAVLSQWIGPVNENRVPYGSSTELDEELRYTADYHVQDVYNVDCWANDQRTHSIEEMKELIIKGNALSAVYNSSSAYYNPFTYSAYCYDPDVSVDHGITIVGWDDNYPKYNFNIGFQPTNNGAWIVKNSWGTGWGNKGYFYLSYEDKSLRDAACYMVEDSDNYSRNYQYDTFGFSTVISADFMQQSKSSYMANIFTAEETEEVSAVAFYTVEPDAEYEITVYTGLTSSSNPTSGVASKATVDSEKYKGYHTIKLDEPVKVEEGQKFSVVVKLTNQTSPYVIPVEATVFFSVDGQFYYNLNYERIVSNTLSNQSFISSNATKWTDTKKLVFRYLTQDYFYIKDSRSIVEVRPGNVCLKAFTSSLYEEVTGDINSDGKLDISDLIIFRDYMTGTADLEEAQSVNADLNDDGKINIIDMVILKSLFFMSE